MVKNRHEARKVRGSRVRYRVKQVRGDRLRLTVFRSSNHIYAQIIDDSQGKTLVAASTVEKEVREGLSGCGNKAAAAVVGKRLAEKALQVDIRKVVFDRGGYLYHGRVKELADAARGAGLDF